MALTELLEEFTTLQRESGRVAAELRKVLFRLEPAHPRYRGDSAQHSLIPAESLIWDAPDRHRARRCRKVGG
jgi:hypothetical protein